MSVNPIEVLASKFVSDPEGPFPAVIVPGANKYSTDGATVLHTRECDQIDQSLGIEVTFPRADLLDNQPHIRICDSCHTPNYHNARDLLVAMCEYGMTHCESPEEMADLIIRNYSALNSGSLETAYKHLLKAIGGDRADKLNQFVPSLGFMLTPALLEGE